MRARLAALAVLFVVLIAGCGGSGGVTNVAQWVGLWVALTETVAGAFTDWGGFQVLEGGAIVDHNNLLTVYGSVNEAGDVNYEAGTVTVTGTLQNDGTGNGTYTDAGGNGNWFALKALADASAYAGTYDMTFAGDATGAGTLTVGADAIIGGTATGAAPLEGNCAGIVGNGGQVVVGDTDANDWVARGQINAAGGNGTWKTSGGQSGTWQATKQ